MEENYLHYGQSAKRTNSFDFPAVLKPYLHMTMDLSAVWPE